MVRRIVLFILAESHLLLTLTKRSPLFQSHSPVRNPWYSRHRRSSTRLSLPELPRHHNVFETSLPMSCHSSQPVVPHFKLRQKVAMFLLPSICRSGRSLSAV